MKNEVGHVQVKEWGVGGGKGGWGVVVGGEGYWPGRPLSLPDTVSGLQADQT